MSAKPVSSSKAWSSRSKRLREPTAMLLRASELRRDGIGGVLVKLVKPGQDKRADLPTIGIDTVQNAAAAGLRGLAFEAKATILAEREACLAAADAADCLCWASILKP